MFNWKMFKGGVALAALAAASAVPAYAQVTTSTIRGTITTEAGAPVSGAAVIVVHEPTGTTSSALTSTDGIYSARNLRVGGPYTVTISGANIRTTEVTDIYLNIDETLDLSLPVSEERTLDAVTVTAPAIAAGYLDTGISTNLGLEELGRVVSIDRDIATLVRDDGEYDPANWIDERDAATPKAMVRLLGGLYRGEYLNEESRRILLGAMSRTVTGKRRIVANMPGEAKVSHKTGSLNNTSSDVGIIESPDGRAVAVAIYVTGQGARRDREARIAAIARALYDGFNAKARDNRNWVSAPRLGGG